MLYINNELGGTAYKHYLYPILRIIIKMCPSKTQSCVSFILGIFMFFFFTSKEVRKKITNKCFIFTSFSRLNFYKLVVLQDLQNN